MPAPTSLPRLVLGRMKFLAPLQLRDFRLLWTGMTVSLLGDGIFFVAVAWQVYALSNAPTALAFVGFAMTLPQVVLLLVGGVVSDRFDRRRVMLASDAVRGLALTAIGVLALSKGLTLPLLIALAGLYGAATAFFGPAFDAIVPDVVPNERLTEANALDQFVRPAALRLAGPALGGLVVAVAGAGYAFVIDGASFGVSALCLSAMQSRPFVRDPSATSSPLRDVLEGLQAVRTRAWLWATFASATLSYLLFIGPSEVLVPFLIKHELKQGAQVFGLVLAAGGVGALGAAAIVGQRGMPRRHLTLMYVAWSLGTLAIAGYGLAVASWQLMLASLLFNGFEAAGTVWWATLKHRLVPPHLRGRVSSFDWFISIGLVPLSYILVGPAVAAIGVRGTLIAAGCIGAVTTFAPMFIRGIRDVERSGLALDEHPDLRSSLVAAG